MSVVTSSPTPTINTNTEEGDGRQEHKQENKDNKNTNEEVERGKEEEEDLLDIAGARGRWSQRIFFLCASMTFTVPLQTMSYQVLGDTPPYWCLPSALAAANWTPAQVRALVVPESEAEKEESCLMYDYNYTLAASLGFEESMADTGRLHEGPLTTRTCSSHYFNSTHSTTVTEWDLVCDRRALYSTTFAISFIFPIVTCFTQGLVIDTFGRGRCAKVFGTLFAAFAMLASCMPSLQWYLIIRSFLGVFDNHLYVSCFVLSLELCTPKQRSAVGNLFALPYALGYMALPGFALLIKDWRLLQVALSAPSLLLLTYHCLLPESPRWLVARGRLEEAADILTKAAIANGNSPPPRDRVMAVIVAIHAKKEKELKDGAIHNKSTDSDDNAVKSCGSRLSSEIKSAWRWCCDVGSNVRALVSTPRLFAVTIVVFFMWFTASSTYYGISLYSVNLSTNLYLYLFLGGLLEIPSYVLLWPLVAYCGRKKTNAGLYLIGTLALILLLLMQGLAPEGPLGISVAASLVGKFASTSCFQLAYLLTGEIYPTGLRSLAVSLCLVFSSIGAAVSPYINDLLVEVVWWGPAAMYGVLSLAASLLTAVLPETTLVALPDTVDDIRVLGEDRPHSRRQSS